MRGIGLEIDWLEERYILDKPFPNCQYVGTSVSPEWAKDYPHLSRKLAWWQFRSVEDLLSIRFVTVLKEGDYWRVGDSVIAKSVTLTDGKVRVVVEGDYSYLADEVIPAKERSLT